MNGWYVIDYLNKHCILPTHPPGTAIFCIPAQDSDLLIHLFSDDADIILIKCALIYCFYTLKLKIIAFIISADVILRH